MLASGTPRRRRPTTFRPRTRARSPCTTTNGGTSRSHHRAGRDERALADAHELRDAAEAAEGRPVLDDGVPRELHAVGEDAVRADDRRRARRATPTMNRLCAPIRVARPSVPPCTVTCSRKTLSLADLERAPGRPRGAWPAARRRRRRTGARRCARPSDGRPAHDGVRVKHAARRRATRRPRRSRTDRRRRPARARRARSTMAVGCTRGASRHRLSRRGRRRSRAARAARRACRRRTPRRGTSTRWCGGARSVTSRSSRSPGRDRAAELRLVDAEEVHERARRVEGLARVREDAADLRERLEDEHARA